MDSKERLLEAERTASEAYALAETCFNLVLILGAKVGLPEIGDQESPGDYLQRLLDMENTAPMRGADLEQGAELPPEGRSR